MGENRDDIIQWACEMALSDSQTALKSLYMTYFGPLMRFTGMYVSSPAEAEEIVSDTFLAIWNNRKQLPGISNFDSYIYTVARHKAISYYRKQHMEQVSLDEISIDLFTSTENDSRRRAYQPRRNSPPELGNRLATRQMQDGFQTRPRGQAQI